MTEHEITCMANGMCQVRIKELQEQAKAELTDEEYEETIQAINRKRQKIYKKLEVKLIRYLTRKGTPLLEKLDEREARNIIFLLLNQVENWFVINHLPEMAKQNARKTKEKTVRRLANEAGEAIEEDQP